MSSILSGGTGRAYGFDIENLVKCTSMMTSSITSHSSSPSSTLSESSNSPHRKPRTPRKRPNQTYNEAAFLLSIACPKVFSTKNNTNLSKLTRQSNSRSSFHKPPELLLPVIENSGFLLNQPIMKEPSILFESSTPTSSCRTCHSLEEVEYRNWNSNSTSLEKPRTLASSCGTCQSPEEVEYGNWNSSSTSLGLCDGFEDNFDTESMLDEEIEEGIDSIMGSSNSIESTHESNTNSTLNSNTCYGYPMGLGFGGNLEFNFGFGMRNGVRALKNGDDGNWWSFPTVNVVNVSPPTVTPVKVKKFPAEKKKMKVEDLMKRPDTELVENCGGDIGSKLLLKLNYDDVLNAWSDKGSPLPEEISGSESADGDIHTRLAQIDLFSENGGLREASVMRYKEKKRTRLFSKKIRYQVRKVNADRRPRSKGRFVRRPNSEDT